MTDLSGTERSLCGMRESLMALDAVLEVASERANVAIASEAGEAKELLSARQFHVVVLGQFKRGKSTLINALIGRDLLPADVAPLTTAITVVQYGPREESRVTYEDGREESIRLDSIAQFVSEEGNPGNGKRVRLVTIDLPLPLLEGGIRLVDTPGVGSVFESNSETTRSFLARVDVALVILGSDPPITGEELGMVRTVAPRADRVWFIMNKADLAPEEVRRKAEAFSRRVLTEALGRDPGEIIHVSARNTLLGRASDGVRRIAGILEELALHSRDELTRQSAAQAAKHLAERLIQQLQLERRGLLAPLAKLDEDIARFDAAMVYMEDLMLVAQVRIELETPFDWDGLVQEKEQFIERYSREITEGVRCACLAVGDGSRKGIRKAAKERALEETKARAEQWRSIAVERFNRHYENRARLAMAEANRIAARISEAASDSFAVPTAKLELQRLDMQPERIHFSFEEPALALDISDWLVPLLDVLSPRSVVIGRAARRAQDLVAEWLMRNLYKVDEHLVEWLDKATRRLTDAMRAKLETMREEVLNAVAAGRREREQGEVAVADRLRVIENRISRLAVVLGDGVPS